MGFENSEVRYLSADQLFVDPNIQRRLKAARTNKLRGKFNPAMMGTLTGSWRHDAGKAALVDGMHRYIAALDAGYEGLFLVNVHRGLTTAEEVDLFLALNDTEKVGALDMYRVRVNGGNDPVATALEKIITDNGWVVSGSKKGGKNDFAAVRALERIYLIDVETAHRVITVPTFAWGYQNHAMDNRLISGLGRVLLHYKEVWDQPARLEDLKDKLNCFPGGPGGLIGQGQQLARLNGTSVDLGVADVIRGEYNKMKRSDGPNFLPPLTKR